MKKILLVLIVLLSSTYNIYSAPGWFSQNSGTSETLNDVFFINSLTGWAVGDTGIIIKTTNGGINWFRQYNPNDKELLAVRFLNENTGWAVGGQTYLNPAFCLDHMIILKTTNGGTNWTIQLYSSNGDIIYGLSLINQNEVYVSYLGAVESCMSSRGGISKTSNGGTNWTHIPNLGFGFGFGYKSIHFINQYTGWAVGCAWSCTYSISRIIKTTNGGINWLTINQDSVNYWSSGKIMFVDELNGYIIGNCIKKTTDGGYNWFNSDSASTMGAKGLFFINKDTGWTVIAYNTGIKRTNNGGINWTSQNTSCTDFIYSVFFVNKNTGWIVGSNGTILKTTTGGLTSIKQTSTLTPDKNTLFQNYPNPFNPTSKIKMQIAESSNVSLIVYDALGKELTTLVNKHLNPGTYEVEFDGSNYTSGVYFYRLQARDYFETRKMLLLK